MFVVKLNADASQVIYATYLGGSSDESFPSLAVDSGGSAVVVGGTNSPEFPTANALQPVFASGNSFYGDAFVTKLSPDGSSLVYSTFLGGFYGEGAADVVVDASGNAYVVGATDSIDFPQVGGIPRTNYSTYPDASVPKINAVHHLLGRAGHGGVPGSRTSGRTPATRSLTFAINSVTDRSAHSVRASFA